jgi:formate hydrogenlyase subunit 6/NADH:ubiquinone oxidoreductase subunit I
MPTQVIVVKRSQRKLFVGPRALPDWLRSLWVARVRRSEKESNANHSTAGSQALDAPVGPSFPRLDFDASGAHRCNGCSLCVSVCPSRCLRLTAEEQGASLSVIAFELVRGSCIGCGICRDVCPESAIEMSPGLEIEPVLHNDRLPVVDLLTVGG